MQSLEFGCQRFSIMEFQQVNTLRIRYNNHGAKRRVNPVCFQWRVLAQSAGWDTKKPRKGSPESTGALKTSVKLRCDNRVTVTQCPACCPQSGQSR